jgi:chromosome segregation ATPase
MPRTEPKRLTPEVTAEIEKALAELAELKAERQMLTELIADSNDRLNTVEKRLKQVWTDVDSMLDETL